MTATPPSLAKRLARWGYGLLIGCALGVHAQPVAQDEHAAHHPELAGTAAPAVPTRAPSPPGSSTMDDMMGGMMPGMRPCEGGDCADSDGGALLSSVLQLPRGNSAARQRLAAEAHRRMANGADGAAAAAR
jgi:hypothetical protein